MEGCSHEQGLICLECQNGINEIVSIYIAANSNQKLTRKDYEAIRDENADPPDVRERANYHEYVRRKLPSLVRSRLESAVSSQFQALADELRTLGYYRSMRHLIYISVLADFNKTLYAI
jgi:hypothetical protein